MADTINGDGAPHSFDRKLDPINDALANLTASMMLQREQMGLQRELADRQFALSETRHQLAMEEIREIREWQREQGIDIMALFQASKETRRRL